MDNLMNLIANVREDEDNLDEALDLAYEEATDIVESDAAESNNFISKLTSAEAGDLTEAIEAGLVDLPEDQKEELTGMIADYDNAVCAFVVSNLDELSDELIAELLLAEAYYANM